MSKLEANELLPRILNDLSLGAKAKLAPPCCDVTPGILSLGIIHVSRAHFVLITIVLLRVYRDILATFQTESRLDTREFSVGGSKLH